MIPSIQRGLGSLLFLAVLVVPVFTGGCSTGAAAGLRVYDVSHQDWHEWNNREESAYRKYVGEKHQEYRDFSTLDRDKQNAYWNWRHVHPFAANS